MIIDQEIVKNGDKAKIVPIKRLQDIKLDIENLKGSGLLNNFQRYIVNDLYITDLPDTDFAIHSIIIVASPSPSLARIAFNRKGKRIPLMLPASYIDKESAPLRIERYLNEFLHSRGYHIQYAPRLPRKLLAVRSGLGVYGRNNLCYVEGMGSFLNLTPFFSDIPCTEEQWHEIRQMDICDHCKACVTKCPTAAIINDQFLINNERCLTYFNEAGAQWDFPEWIEPAAHNSIYGCTSCQTACPRNKAYLDNIEEPAEFTAEETQLLLAGRPFETFPEALREKVGRLAMIDYLGVLPRNLKVLLDQVK